MRRLELMIASVLLVIGACGGSSGQGNTEDVRDTTTEVSDVSTTSGRVDPGTTAPPADASPTTAGDYVGMAEALVPPNGEEFSRLEGESALHISWRSSDSPEKLRDHYEAVLADLGFSIHSTLDPPCCFWGFTTESPATGGSIQVTADGEGSTVAVTASPTG